MAGFGLFGALDIGISGLLTSRLSSQIIGHNIANANTPGYSRQSLDVGTARPLRTTYGTLGRGVISFGVTRAQDRFVERQFFEQNAHLGSYSTLDDTLASVEEVLGSLESNRIGDAMSEFFNAYGDMATPPLTEGKRQSVVSHAVAMAAQLRDVDGSLARLIVDSQQALDAKVAQTNDLLQRIGDLNTQIVANKTETGLPNDLVDQRGQLLTQLSQITRFNLNERADGSVDVIVEGKALVTRGHVNLLRISHETQADGTVRRDVRFGGRDPVSIDFQSGEAAGMVKATNEILPQLRRDLDRLAQAIIEQVNAIHERGVTKAGRGVSLFQGSSAATIKVNQAVVDNVGLLATGESGEEGDNGLALLIAALGDELQPGADLTLNDQYVQLIVGVAAQRGNYDTLRKSQSAIVESAAARLESVRGVNLDEEMAQMLVYQRSFEANARVIQSVDEMLNTLINGMI